MIKVDFTIHRKVTVWTKETYSITANTEEEAKTIIAIEAKYPEYDDTKGFVENLYDIETEEEMIPIDNDNQETIEVTNANDEVILTNIDNGWELL